MTSPPRSRLALALVNAAGLAWAAPAAATPPAAVLLHTSTCQPEDDESLRRALEIELEALEIEPRWASADAVGAPAPITLSAECDPGSGSVALRVWASEPRLVLSRFVALRDVDEPARARTLALVISEALGPAFAGGARAGREAPEPPPSDATPEPVPEPGAARGRRGLGLSRANPYGDVGPSALFTTANPYGMPHALRIGTAAQARLSLRDSSVLLGLELGLSAPISDLVDATLELAYSGGPARTAALPASYWSAALGADFVHYDAIGFSLGPRLTFGHLSVSSSDADPATERTLVTQLGLRSKFEVPVDERLSVLLTFGAQHTLGVYALTYYTGLDEGLSGWIVSWSLGVGVEP